MSKAVRLEPNGDYWSARWRNADGTRGGRTLGRRTGPDKISESKAKAMCADIAEELALEPDKRKGSKAPTIAAWKAQYMALRHDLADGTRYLHELTFTLIEEFFGQDRRLDQITRAGADDWRAWLGATGPIKLGGRKLTGKGQAEATVCLNVRNAKVIMARAAKRGKSTMAFDDLKGTPPKTAPTFATVSAGTDLDKILDQCPDQRWRCVFALARLAGLRRGEAWRLEWGDVDWDAKIIRVLPEADESGSRIEGTKQRAREVPIQAKLYVILREAFEQAEEGSLGPCRGFDRDSFSKEAHRIVKAAGLPKYAKPMHTLRKNLETEWMSQHPVMTVCKWLGHSPRVAAEHYQKPTPAEVARVTGGRTREEELLEEIAELKARLGEPATNQPQNRPVLNGAKGTRTPNP